MCTYMYIVALCHVSVSITLSLCRKERKMFETYQQQARTARDKKDKEDILLLRNEVSLYLFQV